MNKKAHRLPLAKMGQSNYERIMKELFGERTIKSFIRATATKKIDEAIEKLKPENK